MLKFLLTNNVIFITLCAVFTLCAVITLWMLPPQTAYKGMKATRHVWVQWSCHILSTETPSSDWFFLKHGCFLHCLWLPFEPFTRWQFYNVWNYSFFYSFFYLCCWTCFWFTFSSLYYFVICCFYLLCFVCYNILKMHLSSSSIHKQLWI